MNYIENNNQNIERLNNNSLYQNEINNLNLKFQKLTEVSKANENLIHKILNENKNLKVKNKSLEKMVNDINIKTQKEDIYDSGNMINMNDNVFNNNIDNENTMNQIYNKNQKMISLENKANKLNDYYMKHKIQPCSYYPDEELMYNNMYNRDIYEKNGEEIDNNIISMPPRYLENLDCTEDYCNSNCLDEEDECI